MYAIINIAGQQFKVEKDQQIFVHRLPNKEGDKLTFDQVLFVINGDKTEVGAPAVSGASVTAKVIEHVKGDKVIVFKKKRRKGYQTRNGHRQQFTKIAIDGISLNGKKVEKTESSKPAAKTKTSNPVSVKNEAIASDNIEKSKAQPAKDVREEKENNSLLNRIGTAEKSKADDLKSINGIDEVQEKKLNEFGIYTFAQLSKLQAADQKELSTTIGTTADKIEEDEWVKQAKDLLKDK